MFRFEKNARDRLVVGLYSTDYALFVRRIINDCKSATKKPATRAGFT